MKKDNKVSRQRIDNPQIKVRAIIRSEEEGIYYKIYPIGLWYRIYGLAMVFNKLGMSECIVPYTVIYQGSFAVVTQPIIEPLGPRKGALPEEWSPPETRLFRQDDKHDWEEMLLYQSWPQHWEKLCAICRTYGCWDLYSSNLGRNKDGKVVIFDYEQHRLDIDPNEVADLFRRYHANS